ncbi:MAG: DUF805 domain-containing protein [Candidatus Thiodiazotropha sp. (ex Myrtea sp. 'scaly one' KF741663)]|nr:DUF805 domain-containing protein [Candidatus Thiodiazotropha sp. (ex Myrtea sp. 'scaly one' KF741663)]
METTNPYTPPQGELLDEQLEYQPVKILSAKGRMGRLRYIGYGIGIALLSYLVMALLTVGVGAVMPEAIAGAVILGIFILGYAALIIISVLLTIQRCHDFNVTGWLSLILLIPLLPLIFWFIPGTQGANNFGAPPPPNRGGAAVVVAVLAIVVVVGILAAIAIPAYQDYVLRAQEMQM